MPHQTSFIASFVIGLGLAFVFGAVANRLRTSPLVGYLLAGVAVGPFTPGFVADQSLAPQLAEIGVILLMFGVGLHFSVNDLLAVRRIALPGALIQVIASTLVGMGLAALAGWSIPAGFVFGLSLSVASTVVLTRALQDRRLIESERGHVAVGWLVVQDLLMVVALVLLPAIAGLLQAGAPGGGALDLRSLAETLGLTLGKVIVFVAFMLVVGRRAIPAVLHYIAHTGSRELFRLAVLSLALGVAFAASELFGVSFALGAFVAGMTLSESALSQAAAEETLPLRDAFAVLFFVSVGMLFNPAVLIDEPGLVAGALAVVLVGNPAIAFGVVRLLGQPAATALLLAAGLAQIGEFSFILADLGLALGFADEQVRDVVLAASIVSIVVNPLVFVLIVRRRPAEPPGAAAEPEEAEAPTPTALTDHVVLVGYGRVGRLVAEGLVAHGRRFLVIEDAGDAVEQLRQQPVETILGNAADARILGAANLAKARLLLVAIPNAFEAGQIVEQARAANPDLEIIARAHFDAEVEHLTQRGATRVVMGEREIARSMLQFAGDGEGSVA